MSDAPPAVTSLEGLGVHVWHLQQLVMDSQRTLKNVATHEDVRAIHVTLATLATRAELDSKVRDVREDYERRFQAIQTEHRQAITALQNQIENQRPSKIFKSVVVTATGLLAIGALLAALHGVSLWVAAR